MNNATRLFVLFALLFCIIAIGTFINKYKQEQFEDSPIRVYFDGFWPGFNEDSKKPFLEIAKIVFNQNCVSGNENDSSVIIQSVFGADKEKAKKFKYKIFHTGENYKNEDINAYDILLAGEETNGKYISFPLFLLYLSPEDISKYQQYTPPRTTVPEKDVITIISNSGGNIRNTFLEELEKHFEVSYGGGYKNNIGGRLPHKQGTPEYNEFVGKYKFIITMENSEAPHYITEKILQGFGAQIIPIYWGGNAVHNYFNKDRFIHLKDSTPESMQDVISKMKFLKENPDKWLEMVNKPIFTGPNNTLSYKLENVAFKIKEKLGL